MNLQAAINERRSVKHFDAQHQLTQAEVDQLLHDAIYAPTSFNIQHWRFVRVTDDQLRQQLRQAAWDQAQVTEASELFVITGDVNAWQKEPQRYWANADQGTRDMLVNMIGDFYQGRDWIQRDEVMRSGAFAAQNLMLSAKSMGYDSCPMIGFDQDKVAELVALPDDHIIVMMLAVGKAVEQARPRGGQLPLEEVVITNRFAAV